jgi:hypothetical protein
MGVKKQLLKHETAELARENIRNDSFAQVCGVQKGQGPESGWLAEAALVAAGSSQPVLISPSLPWTLCAEDVPFLGIPNHC